MILLQDHALPVGTEVTDRSLVGVLGREREICVPVASTIAGTNADGDDRGSSNDNCCSNTGGSDNSNNNNSIGSSDKKSRVWLGQSLVLKLRQVNGDGVMSGVW